jgi:hypothetical protein
VAPLTTTTTLAAQPAGPVAAGSPVTLSATVSPAVGGTVQFRDGTTDLGAAVPVSGGNASSVVTAAAGVHSFTASFAPAAGGDYTGSTSSAVSFVVDGTPPTVQITDHPANPTASTTAHVAFSGSDSDSPPVSFTCRLDTGPANTCTGSADFSGVTDGSHTFTVTATDGVGNSAQATATWTVDTVKPAVTLTAPRGPGVLTAKTTVQWKGSDGSGTGIATYRLRYRQAPWNGRLGAWSMPGAWQALTTTTVSAPVPVGYTRCFSVMAVDKTGNTSAWSGARCTTRPLDDRALKASAGWTRRKAAGFYFGTYTATMRKGSTLTRGNAQLDRVGVVATTCPTCGRLAVYVGSKLIGTIDLHRAKTRHEALLVLPSFPRRTGTVTLKVLISGKSVQVDGLLVSSA